MHRLDLSFCTTLINLQEEVITGQILLVIILFKVVVCIFSRQITYEITNFLKNRDES